MRTFLGDVAARLYARYGDDVSSLSILFSSRRARLFFADALSEVAHGPLWEPEYLSVDELMSELSGLRQADRLRLVAELFDVYSKYHREDFDRFYFWGEMLLADFDMIDKYLVDASQLFRNISDIKELEADTDYLTPEQLRIVSFWRTIGPEGSLSEQKRAFLEVWRSLGTVYSEFRGRLLSMGIGYAGLIYREAVAAIERGEASFSRPRRYVVAGFNALSACERRLFSYLSTACGAEFFWDYDDYYVRDVSQEAGLFVRRNIAEFPSGDGVSHDNFRHIRSLHDISCVSNVAQCKHAASLLNEIASRNGGEHPFLDKRTAVVLTDENLLVPLLYSLPDVAGGVNVTMGYPLKSTLAASLVERLLALQTHVRRREGKLLYYHVDVNGLLAHPYVASVEDDAVSELRGRIIGENLIYVPEEMLSVTPLFGALFRHAEGWRGLLAYLRGAVAAIAEAPCPGGRDRYRMEFLSAMSDSLSRLFNVIDACGIDISEEICRSLVRRHIQTERIPFEGEPLEGLQVMGILETRNLDFRDVIILSMTDDNFPGNRMSDSSFIPYGLRYAYGLPTPELHEAVYAYYFYRLIQRAENVYMLYCSHADERSTGEPSRYIRQLEYETALHVERSDVGLDVSVPAESAICIPKTPDVIRVMESYVDGSAELSPTAFSRYVQCPLKFYFYSVAKVRTDDELSEEVDGLMFGNIFHKAAELLYGHVVGEKHPAAHLRRLLDEGVAERCVDSAINIVYFGRDADAPLPAPGGELMVIREIVLRYLRDNVARYDIDNGGFTVLATESRVGYLFPFESGGRSLEMHFSGIADRIDRLDDGSFRVVDYKTGSEHLEMGGVGELFTGEAKDRQSNFINTLLYSMMIYRSQGRDVHPELYYVRKMSDMGYSPLITDKSTGVSGAPYSACMEEFEAHVARALDEIYDADTPFRQTEDRKACISCDFAPICFRKEE